MLFRSTVTVTNYNALWTWTYTVSSGKVAVSAPSGSTVTVTVSGLKSTQLSTLTVKNSRTGYSPGSASITS